MRILVVGAGFAGAVHARQLAEAGHDVRVIDVRPHIGGNCHEEIVEGCRLHRYGPHLFHTDNQRVVDWLSRFTDWTPYEHRVRARLADGRLVPLPLNLTALGVLNGRPLQTPGDVERFLETRRLPIPPDPTAHDWLRSQIGEEITELFYARYTEKMWALRLEDIDVAVVKRVQVRLDDDDRYFKDSFQAMPAAGYNALFAEILRHPGISVELDTPFAKEMETGFDFCFNSMAIDEYFEFVHGRLPYRSIRFHHRPAEPPDKVAATINFTDRSPFTRETYWNLVPTCGGSNSICTREEPCSDEENGFERYYPVKTQDDSIQRTYQAYLTLAGVDRRRKHFIGRCGTYQYLDMHQVVNQSLQNAEHFIRATN